MDMTVIDWSDKLILVADDVHINYSLISILLRNTKAKMLWAPNGKDAVNMVQDNPNIDLILMDIRMPVMNGYEATAEIKKMNKNIPIIAQTSYALSEDRDKCLQSGCDDFIAKPIMSDVLIEIISKYFCKELIV
jgi:two-component system, cell cycle response regulator DivK